MKTVIIAVLISLIMAGCGTFAPFKAALDTENTHQLAVAFAVARFCEYKGDIDKPLLNTIINEGTALLEMTTYDSAIFSAAYKDAYTAMENSADLQAGTDCVKFNSDAPQVISEIQEVRVATSNAVYKKTVQQADRWNCTNRRGVRDAC